LLALLSAGTPAVAQAEEDPWFGPDKAKHFGASAVLAAGGYGIGAVAFDERTSALLLGGGIALTAGVGKEVHDAAGGGRASGRDLVWDAVGTAAGLGAAWALDLLFRGNREATDDPVAASPGALVVRF
jgi:putative lipoprotein